LNDQPGLRRTYRSLQEQAERDLEWIVVDGASGDGCVEFLKKLALPFLRWVSERDRGIYDAMNKGTRLARGRYVIYMNAGDNFADQDSLLDLKRCIESAGMPDLCLAGCKYRFSDRKFRYRPPRRMESAIRHGLPAMHQATVYRREFLDDPPYDLSYPVSADYFVAVRCFIRGARACYLNRAVSLFDVGGNSTMKVGASMREHWRMQRDLLRQGWPMRILSAARRFIAGRIIKAMHASARRS
jgi:putative colanic acid biosynthesis glycosyltransferase